MGLQAYRTIDIFTIHPSYPINDLIKLGCLVPFGFEILIYTEVATWMLPKTV